MGVGRRLIALATLLVAGCSATFPVAAPTIAPAAGLFRSTTPIVLVITPELTDFQHTERVPNWAMGAFAKDKLTFKVGLPVASVVKQACEIVFSSVEVVSTVAEAQERANRVYVVPEISLVGLDHPVFRFATIAARVEVVFNAYRGKSAAQTTVVGEGAERLKFSRGNHKLALERAIEDLATSSLATLPELVAEIAEPLDAAHPVGDPSTMDKQTRTVGDRLRELENLKAEGLLSDSEYQQERRRILSEL